jgi:3-deoxy-D-arabino-heptulosonate 7-phosphate (DAHP) synthase
MLANCTAIPAPDPAFYDKQVSDIMQYFAMDAASLESELHRYAASLLDQGKLAHAWQVLLSAL